MVGSFALLPKPDVPSPCCRRRWPHTMALEPLLLLWRSQPAATAKGAAAAAAAVAAVAVAWSEAADVMRRPAHCIPCTPPMLAVPLDLPLPLHSMLATLLLLAGAG